MDHHLFLIINDIKEQLNRIEGLLQDNEEDEFIKEK